MSRGRQWVLVGLGGVLAAAVLVLLVLRLAADPDVHAQLGDPVFSVGNAKRIAGQIERGGPFLFQDPIGHGRHVWLVHDSGDPQHGWYAVEARVGTRCEVTLDRSTRRFRDPCHNRRFPAEVDTRGQVVIDLRR
ncbi:MAG TPA: hypothetical protein VM030_05700 [Acidimicrobiales bacterium]|nr:hypothetical protein [Acidimicrobiales bacterium]